MFQSFKRLNLFLDVLYNRLVIVHSKLNHNTSHSAQIMVIHSLNQFLLDFFIEIAIQRIHFQLYLITIQKQSLELYLQQNLIIRKSLLYHIQSITIIHTKRTQQLTFHYTQPQSYKCRFISST
ncbi:hypothetical protein IMG5_045780 [Ichthyophthirius multifiliis]|uniref:Uncharacterized protein n=1 Tax=Ichthyophthirius multifiliis TaxID=5932 RepID=G0QM69_ICHMU|nr:hypothetical protein IMG5_045780 [Ichthyophthirius multifiliis]EGR33686.1 hypothetical protein IMG5_045780 [Ichthyophthirius multifiliis]|eukprot:XP_004037672.1 hypothetical protein IMG5_045780 [Ichthyophthirius multifiliis]